MSRAAALAPRICGVWFVTAAVLAGEPFRRELSTDRPDATESPFTVEAGRFQIEHEAVRWTRDSEGPDRVTTVVLGATNLKYGLSSRVDLQLLLEPYVRVSARSGAVTTRDTGFGDTVIRLKTNLLGNDTAGFAAGIMPFVKFPTASDDLGNGNLEGGLILPVAVELDHGWGAGFMAEFDAVRDEADEGHELAVVWTATASREIGPGVGLFLELANQATSWQASTWATTFNTGVTIALSPNVQLDAGGNVGISGEADDLAAFVGVSTRF